MDMTERNKTARSHGRKGERQARAWLKKLAPNVQVYIINELLDLLIGRTYIEVKTCADYISSGDKYERRAGRYTIERDQHDLLTSTDGYYLFVVLHDIRPATLFLCRARNQSFHKQIAWTTALRSQITPKEAANVISRDE